MSTTLVIVVAAIVILITALVLIGVFTGGIATFQNIFNPWAQQTGLTALCQSKCQTGCIANDPPKGPDYSVEIDGEMKDCPGTCVCEGWGTQTQPPCNSFTVIACPSDRCKTTGCAEGVACCSK